MKTCTKCKQSKPLDQFSALKRSADGRYPSCKLCEYHSRKAYRDATKEAQRERSRAHYQRNKEHIKERARADYRANKSDRSEYAKAAYETNRDKFLNAAKKRYSEKREDVLAYQREYYKNNSDIVKARSRERDARLRGTPDYMAKLRSRVTAYRANKLQASSAWANQAAIDAIYLGAQLMSRATGIKHHVDHIVPLRSKLVCGLHNEFNLRVIPATQNLSKSNKHWPDMP